MPGKRKGISGKLAGSPALNLVNRATGSKRSGTGMIKAASDLKKLSASDRVFATPIAFGKPSSSGTVHSSSSTSNWQSLINKGVKSGFSSEGFGGGLLGLGLSTLVSGLSDLFGGGQKTEEPLKLFSLPDVQDVTAYQSTAGLSGTANESAGDRSGRSGLYGRKTSATDQASVVKAVKQALLTSSSLNDIIGDL